MSGYDCRQQIAVLAIAWLGTVAFACAEPPKSRPNPAIKVVPEELAADVAATPEAESYVYLPVGKRDPFLAPAGPKTVAPPHARASALTRYEVSDLRLAFANRSPSDPLAVVMDPSGRGHIVAVGDFIGKKWGQIIAIGHDEIVIRDDSQSTGSDSQIVPELMRLRIAQPKPVDTDEDDALWNYASPG